MSPMADSVSAVMVGTDDIRLDVLRGNSASGKSSVAAGLRDRFGRGLALVAQDNLRRIVLRERDRPGAANIGLIDLTARYALHAGYHVVVEGILHADRYGPYQDLVTAPLPVTETAAARQLSLPCYPAIRRGRVALTAVTLRAPL